MEKQHSFQKIGINMKRPILGCAFSLFLFLTTSSLEADFAYATNNGSNTVSVIDTSPNTAIATVTVGTDLLGIAIPSVTSPQNLTIKRKVSQPPISVVSINSAGDQSSPTSIPV